MKLEYMIVRLLLNYDRDGKRIICAIRGEDRKLGTLKTYIDRTLEEFLDELGDRAWELTAGTTALTATITDIHLVLRRTKEDHREQRIERSPRQFLRDD